MEIPEKSTSRVDSAVDVLSGKLKDILAQKEKGVIQVDSDCIVVEAAKKMRDNKVGALMVLENGKLVGIFTERDLMSRVVAASLDPETVDHGKPLVFSGFSFQSLQQTQTCFRKRTLNEFFEFDF